MHMGIRWINRPIFNSYHRLCFSISSSSKVSQCIETSDRDCNDFLPWLERKAGIDISSVLSIGKSSYGRSLFASKFIEYGDCVLRVPFDVQITPDDLLPEIKSLLHDEVANVSKLALVILVEQKLGQDSEWHPYISRLPQPGEMHSPIFWSKDELEMIRQSSVYQETINQKTQIEKEFLAIRPVLDHFPDFFGDITLDDFMHAFSLVGSRAWGSMKGLSLIPFADFLNHDGATEAALLSDEHKKLSEVIAGRNYEPGEEVLIRYGKFSNATLLLDFGFTLPHNIHDQVQIKVDIPDHDLLREMKLELLQRHCAPTIKDVNGCNFSWDSFIIKEVRSARGKGVGIPQSLRAFARVLNSRSAQELSDLAVEASQHDGRLARRPLKNHSDEILAHQILLSRITQLIEEYNASIKALKPFNSASETLALRRQMALDLLNGERRVLTSAASWLKNYCANLPNSRHIQ